VSLQSAKASVGQDHIAEVTKEKTGEFCRILRFCESCINL